MSSFLLFKSATCVYENRPLVVVPFNNAAKRPSVELVTFTSLAVCAGVLILGFDVRLNATDYRRPRQQRSSVCSSHG